MINVGSNFGMRWFVYVCSSNGTNHPCLPVENLMHSGLVAATDDKKQKMKRYVLLTVWIDSTS